MLNLDTPIAASVIHVGWLFGYITVQFFILAQFFYDMLTVTNTQHYWESVWDLVSHQSYLIVARIIIDLVLCILRIPKLMERNNQLLEEFLVAEDTDEASETDSDDSMPSLEPISDDEESENADQENIESEEEKKNV